MLFKEGIALQIKNIFLQMLRAREQEKAMREGMNAAEENRGLNMRAYQGELVETREVIEAQLIEAIMKAQHQKVLYDHLQAQACLDFFIGREVTQLLKGGFRETH